MPEPEPITEAEWDILAVLWEEGRATAPHVAASLAGTRQWAYSTVKTMLDRMKAKGLVQARRVGSVWEYSPAVEPDAARRGAWRRFVEAAFGGAMAPALHFIANDARLTPRQRQTLRRLLEEAQGDPP